MREKDHGRCQMLGLKEAFLNRSCLPRSNLRLKSSTLNTTPVPSPIPVLTMAFEMQRSVCQGRKEGSREILDVVLLHSYSPNKPDCCGSFHSSPSRFFPTLSLILTFRAMMSSEGTFSCEGEL